MRALSTRRRCHGSSCRKRYATSNVAPPHISCEKKPAARCAVACATRSMSRVRTRVASSDWCASRNVVSVNRTARCCSTHLDSPAAPCRSNTA